MDRKRPPGRLTRTARQCVQAGPSMVDKIRSIPPVTGWTLEVSRFAFMHMEDGAAQGIDFHNRTLKSCGGVCECVPAQQGGRWPLRGGPIGHCDHLVPKLGGGSDGPQNIVRSRTATRR